MLAWGIRRHAVTAESCIREQVSLVTNSKRNGVLMLEDMTEEELIAELITCDSKGKKIKALCLEELLLRARCGGVA